jgi:hypothetical protein
MLPAPRARTTVQSQREAAPAYMLARVASVIRTVAGAMIDVADAAAAALTKRLEGST